MKSISYHLYAETTFKTHIRAFQRQIKGLKQNDDIEFLHQLRVAFRRLRNALWVFQDLFSKRDLRRWKKALRRLAQTAGEARDLDVQIFFLKAFAKKTSPSILREGIEEFIILLQKKRQRLQPHLIQHLRDLKQKKILQEIQAQCPLAMRTKRFSRRPKLLNKLARKKILKRLKTLLAFEPFVMRPSCVEELHGMRIAAKHLRYTLETFEQWYGRDIRPLILSAKAIQRILGRLHDEDVWIQTLPQFICRRGSDIIFKSALENLRQECQISRQQTYRDFVEFWQRCQRKKEWKRLKKLVNEAGRQRN